MVFDLDCRCFWLLKTPSARATACDAPTPAPTPSAAAGIWNKATTSGRSHIPAYGLSVTSPGPSAIAQIIVCTGTGRPTIHWEGTCHTTVGLHAGNPTVSTMPYPSAYTTAIIAPSRMMAFNCCSTGPSSAQMTVAGRTYASTYATLSHRSPRPEDNAAVVAALRPQGEANFPAPTRAARLIAKIAKPALRLLLCSSTAPKTPPAAHADTPRTSRAARREAQTPLAA